MNSVRSIICVTIRGYARGSTAGFKFSKAHRKPATPTEKELYPDVNEYNYDPNEHYDDFSDAESDFSNLGRSYTEHQREVNHAKDVLKKRIITRKYFKSTDPNFITWTEKDQIQTLHARDSVEWTPERLSESFPALPETIRRILRAKWSPKSVETVVKHDQGVIENWNLLRTGSLALDPRLEEHLKKFKDRKIEIANLTTIAEKFVKKPPVFPTPKSQIFSGIIRTHIGHSPKETEKNTPQITDGIKETKPLATDVAKSINSNKRVTFDAFLEKEIDKFAGDANLSLENQLLVDEYKKQRSIEAFNDDDSAIPQCNTKEPSAAAATVEPTTAYRKITKFDIKGSSVDTGVLEWKKKELSNDGDYPDFIKIPRTKAKSGVTFKVKDRYYDTDGEFLYRVPGLRT